MKPGGEPAPTDSTATPQTTDVTPFILSLFKRRPAPVVSPQTRLEELIGRDFARFLISSLSDSPQGRRG